jgi:hypothetical protein
MLAAATAACTASSSMTGDDGAGMRVTRVSAVRAGGRMQ